VQVVGWADAGKLGGSLPLGYPVTGTALSGGNADGYSEIGDVVASDGATYTCGFVRAQLSYAGQRQLPPVTATFLAYGSVPVTATASLVQDGPAPVQAIAYQQIFDTNGTFDEGYTYTTVVTTSRVLLRVTQVKVNGVPLAVGGHCQTTGPVYTPDPALDPGDNQLVVSGGNAPGEPEPRQQSLPTGGAQAGLATVPPFTGCVTPSGENLNVLLDSSLSGPGNYVRVDQGTLCSPVVASGVATFCTTPATNQPLYPPLWTVSHGGPYSASATAPLKISERSGFVITTITCPGSVVSGVIPDSAGPPRGPDGTFGWSGTLDCSDTKSNSWTITQEGTGTLVAGFYVPATQTSSGTVDDLTLDVQGPGGCTAQLTGALPMTYANSTGQLTLLPAGTGLVTAAGGAALLVASSTCTQLPPTVSNQLTAPKVTASYALASGAIITSP
jgi:hypothetical protein